MAKIILERRAGQTKVFGRTANFLKAVNNRKLRDLTIHDLSDRLNRGISVTIETNLPRIDIDRELWAAGSTLSVRYVE